MTCENKYLFGPVASRRLGLSLGVEIVPFKTCTYDCPYCECGSTGVTTLTRKRWIDSSEVLCELEGFLAEDIPADYITITGSGEPTLNSEIGDLIHAIKERTSIPVAVLTNGSLLSMPEVRKELRESDMVVPSLDAASERVFRRINRPHKSLVLDTIIEGLIQFRKEYRNSIWLEVLFCRDINDSPDEIRRIIEVTRRINPERVQIGSLVRPPAVAGTQPVTYAFLEQVLAQMGETAEIMAPPPACRERVSRGVSGAEIINLLQRRPTTAEEMSRAFCMPIHEMHGALGRLVAEGFIISFDFEGITFYKVK